MTEAEQLFAAWWREQNRRHGSSQAYQEARAAWLAAYQHGQVAGLREAAEMARCRIGDTATTNAVDAGKNITAAEISNACRRLAEELERKPPG